MSNEELIAEAQAMLLDSEVGTRAERDVVMAKLVTALEAQSAPLLADSREALDVVVYESIERWADEIPSPIVHEYVTRDILASGAVSLAADRDRAMKAQGWDECMAEVRSEIRALPSWASPNGEHGFDLQPLGPDASSEEGARVAIFGVLDATANPYRESEGK